MLFNKNKSQIDGNKKVLRKHHKQWIIISSISLTLMGGSAVLFSGVSAHADTTTNAAVPVAVKNDNPPMKDSSSVTSSSTTVTSTAVNNNDAAKNDDSSTVKLTTSVSISAPSATSSVKSTITASNSGSDIDSKDSSTSVKDSSEAVLNSSNQLAATLDSKSGDTSQTSGSSSTTSSSTVTTDSKSSDASQTTTSSSVATDSKSSNAVQSASSASETKSVTSSATNSSSVAISGSFTFDRETGVRDLPDMSLPIVSYFASGANVSYSNKVNADNHQWLTYQQQGKDYYVPYKNTVNNVEFGKDSNNLSAAQPSSKSTTYTVNLNEYNLNNTGDTNAAKDNAAAFNQLTTDAKQFQQTNVEVPAGLYYFRTIYMASNMSFNFDNGAIFQSALGTSDVIEYPAYNSQPGVSNITWNNAYFKGSIPSTTTEYEPTTGKFVHNIVRADNIHFNNSVFDNTEAASGHCLDIQGSTNITVNGCTFLGVGGGTANVDFQGGHHKEAIQIDYDSYGSSSAPDDIEQNRGYTNVGSSHIVIDGNVFLPIYSDQSGTQLVKYGPLPVGEHSQDANNNKDLINNVIFSNNYVLDSKPVLDNKTGLNATVHFPGVYQLYLLNNNFDRRIAPASADVILVNVWKNANVGNIVILNNEFHNMDPSTADVAKTAQSYSDYLKGPAYFDLIDRGVGANQSTGSIQNVTIGNNKIYTGAQNLVPSSTNGVGNNIVNDPQASKIIDYNNQRIADTSANNDQHASINVRIVPVDVTNNQAIGDGTSYAANGLMPYDVATPSISGYQSLLSQATIGTQSGDYSLYVPYVKLATSDNDHATTSATNSTATSGSSSATTSSAATSGTHKSYHSKHASSANSASVTSSATNSSTSSTSNNSNSASASKSQVSSANDSGASSTTTSTNSTSYSNASSRTSKNAASSTTNNSSNASNSSAASNTATNSDPFIINEQNASDVSSLVSSADNVANSLIASSDNATSSDSSSTSTSDSLASSNTNSASSNSSSTSQTAAVKAQKAVDKAERSLNKAKKALSNAKTNQEKEQAKRVYKKALKKYCKAKKDYKAMLKKAGIKNTKYK